MGKRRFRKPKNSISPRMRAKRSSTGVYLVEILVAIMVGAMLTFALLQTAAISSRHATSTQNEVFANTIIRELMEATRATNYNDLEVHPGEHTLLTNKTSAGQLGPAIREDPLQLNTIDKSWEFPSQNSRFRGDVKYKIENGPEPETLKVTITVSWVDSSRFNSSDGKRTVAKSTIVSKYGAHAWNTIYD